MQNLAEEDKNAMATNTLDSLPVELKLCILQQMPNLKSIHDLTLASSKYYQTYTKFRSQVLYDLLLRQHNGEVDITEAVVAMRSEGVIAEDVRNQDKIFDLLDCRRRGTKELRTKFRHDSFTVKEIVKMMKLHEAAEYCIKDYAATLPRPDWWEDKRKWEPPFDFSHTERARFFRAFYRLQTWCHIFGQPEYHCSSPSSAPPFSFRLDRQSENDWTDRTFTHEQAWRMIWGTMPPWEVEEVGCLVDYSMLKYIHIFKEITTALINGYHPGDSAEEEEEEEDTEPSSPTSSSRATSLPVGTEPLGSVYRSYETHGDPWSLARAFRYSMIEIGPYFLYKILQKPYDERHLAVSSNLRSVSITKLWEVTSLDDDQKLPLVSPADKYEREDLATIISSWHVLDRPNKSWILHWGRELHPRMWLGRESSPYSTYPIINRSMWTWGYVLWDDKRLDEWEAGYSFFT